MHGIFDKGEIAGEMIRTLAENKGIKFQQGLVEDYEVFKERQYDKLAETLRNNLNMEEIYGMLEETCL